MLYTKLKSPVVTAVNKLKYNRLQSSLKDAQRYIHPWHQIKTRHLGQVTEQLWNL